MTRSSRDSLSPGMQAIDLWRIRTADRLFPYFLPVAGIRDVNHLLNGILADVLTATSGHGCNDQILPAAARAAARRELEPIIAAMPAAMDPAEVYEGALARPVVRREDGSAALQKGIRRSRGAYYTPRVVTGHILSTAIRAAAATLPGEEILLCDPACGCGSFLCAAQEMLQGGDEAAAFPSFFLYGLDLDPHAVRIARMRLADTASADPRASIATGDALVGSDCDAEIRRITQPFDWQEEFSPVFDAGGFSIICGNPPWGSQGLRGAEPFPRPLERYLRRHYPRSAEYKLNTAFLFIERSISLLREGGVCGFIVPDSILIGKYAAKLRSLILDTCRILEIVLIGKDFWQGATPGRSVILLLQKEPDPARRAVHQVTASFASSLDALEYRALRTFRYSQAYYHTLPYHRFRLFFDADTWDFVHAMEAGSVPLHSCATLHTGVRSRVGKGQIVSAWWKGPEWRAGIISGSEVTPYALVPGGMYIRIRPDLLWGGGWDPSVVLREKLVIRQTGDCIIAAYDRQRHYHLNNCHSLLPTTDRMPPAVILALLNSRALNCYYQLISLERGRPLAQVDIDLLQELPLHIPSPKVMGEMQEQVKKIQTCAEKIRMAPPGSVEAERWCMERDRAVAFLQDLVNRTFGVSDSMTRLAERTRECPPARKN